MAVVYTSIVYWTMWPVLKRHCKWIRIFALVLLSEYAMTVVSLTQWTKTYTHLYIINYAQKSHIKDTRKKLCLLYVQNLCNFSTILVRFFAWNWIKQNQLFRIYNAFCQTHSTATLPIVLLAKYSLGYYSIIFNL